MVDIESKYFLDKYFGVKLKKKNLNVKPRGEKEKGINNSKNDGKYKISS